jgi:predicted nucleic acid-binding protein
MSAAEAGFTLDAGALIALERNDPAMFRLLRKARVGDAELAVPRSVIAQVWRGTPRQANIALLLKVGGTPVPSVIIDELTDERAKKIGIEIGRSAHPDIVDVHVALVAREHGHAVITSDGGDIAKIDSDLEIIHI